MPKIEDFDPSTEEKVVDNKPSIVAADFKEPNIFEIKGLPSRGKLYAKGCKLYGRPLKVVEVKKLSTMTELNADYIINDILKRTIKGIDIGKLLIADKLFLVFWLRANTYRETGFSIDFECTQCKEKGRFDFTIDNLDVTYLPDNWKEDQMTFKTLKGDKISFHLLTVNEENDASKFKARYGKILDDIDNEILSLALMIDEINGEKIDLLDKYNYLISDEVGPENYAYIISYMKQYDCGVSSMLEAKCEKCGGVTPVGITFREEFFLPEYKFK